MPISQTQMYWKEKLARLVLKTEGVISLCKHTHRTIRLSVSCREQVLQWLLHLINVLSFEEQWPKGALQTQVGEEAFGTGISLDPLTVSLLLVAFVILKF